MSNRARARHYSKVAADKRARRKLKKTMKTAALEGEVLPPGPTLHKPNYGGYLYVAPRMRNVTPSSRSEEQATQRNEGHFFEKPNWRQR